MFRECEFVPIMEGDFAQLNCVCRYVRLFGIDAKVRLGSLYEDAQLLVDKKRELGARRLVREYVDSYKRQLVLKLDMRETFLMSDSEENVAI